MKAPKIEDYRFGQMIIDGRTYTRNLVLLPDRVMANWWRKEGHRALRAAGIDLRVARTGDAWGVYNNLRGHHATAGAFHLTC